MKTLAGLKQKSHVATNASHGTAATLWSPVVRTQGLGLELGSRLRLELGLGLGCRHPLLACGAQAEAHAGGTCGKAWPPGGQAAPPCQPPCASGATGAQAAERLPDAGKAAALCAVNAAAAPRSG